MEKEKNELLNVNLENKFSLQNNMKVDTKEDIKKLFEEEFASGVNYVFVNAIKKEIGFKEVTVLQQKTLSRITLANENRKDVIYDSQCQLINSVCLADNFDIYNLTEFDRLKILMALYQQNMFQNDITFTCKHCGYQNKYKMSFENAIKRLDGFSLDSKEFTYENKNFKYVFQIAYPNVKLISNFHRMQYARQQALLQSRENKNISNISVTDYINLYITKVNILNKKSGKQKEIDFKYYSVSDINDIVQMFPQDVLYSDNGVISFIIKNFIQNISSVFDEHRCTNCGKLNEEGEVNSAASFL